MDNSICCKCPEIAENYFINDEKGYCNACFRKVIHGTKHQEELEIMERLEKALELEKLKCYYDYIE